MFEFGGMVFFWFDGGDGDTLVRTYTRVQEGKTALIYSAISGHADSARLLLDAGADTNAKANVRGLPASVCFLGR